MRRSLLIHGAAVTLSLGLVLSGCTTPNSGIAGPSTLSAVNGIPTLEVAYPSSFNLSGTTRSLSSRSISGSSLDPSTLDDIRSEAWVAFKKEISNPDGPNVNAYIKRFQNYMKTLASIQSGSPITMPTGLGSATFSSSSLSGGGLETTIHWTLPQTVPAATVTRMSNVDWSSVKNAVDGTASLTLNVYMDIKQDSSANMTGFVFQLSSVQTYTPSGSSTAVPFVKISATNDGAGTYALYSFYYGNIRYEKSTASNGTVTFVKQIDRSYPEGYDSTTGTYDYPNGREFYYYGYGDANEGGITYLDYDPKFASNPAAATDIYLHREIFDASGNLLFKQYGLTNPTNSKLLADYAANGYNLKNVGLANGVSVGSGSGSVNSTPWKLTITYSLSSSGSGTVVSSIDGVKAGSSTSNVSGFTAASGLSLPDVKFYYQQTAGTWSPGDAVYYPQQVVSSNLTQVTQIFIRGYTMPNTANVLGVPFYVAEKYPLKYMTLSANVDANGQAYNSTTAAAPYAFYNWLGTSVNNIVWYDLNDVRHADGTYVPKLYWISKQSPTGGSVTYSPAAGDLRITGVEMAKAYTLSVDASGNPVTTLDFVPMLDTTNLSQPSASDVAAGVVTSGLYGELPLFLNWTSQPIANTVLSNLESQETSGDFAPGTLNLGNFLASATMSNFQPAASFPTI